MKVGILLVGYYSKEVFQSIQIKLSVSPGDSELEDTVAAEIDGECEDHPTGIVLRRIGYYTIPPLDELTSLIDSDGRCIVDNFTIGRLNYGNIFYPDSFDVTGLNIDEIGR
jgi:nuclear pore complex protein Nup98-Nup96